MRLYLVFQHHNKWQHKSFSHRGMCHTMIVFYFVLFFEQIRILTHLCPVENIRKLWFSDIPGGIEIEHWHGMS